MQTDRVRTDPSVTTRDEPARASRYVQAAPELPDPYTSDHVLRSYLDRYLGPDRAADAEVRLRALAADVAGPLRAAHADAEEHPPVLRQYDAWGARIDRIESSAGWETLRAAAARHHVVGLPYAAEARARYGAGARIVQHALLHLYGPESATFSCPVAMSDGAAALLSHPGTGAGVRDAWLPRLISADPSVAITSGQWMTESQGGSDIARSTTSARLGADGTWRLTGEKWFCSAADAAMAVALARPEGAGPGSRTLAPFVVPRYAAAGSAEAAGAAGSTGDLPAPGLMLHRLKEKLGTRAVPTAEIGLAGAVAYPVGDPSYGGLARMLTLVVITRLHNAAAAAGGMRRGLSYAREYAAVRTIAGGRLDANPLHRATLAKLAADSEAAFALTMHAFALLGRVEVDGDAGAADELRLVAPLAKIATGRLAVAAASEFLECFGGAGYVEETGIPRLLRDAQVLPIWEGTSNVLSADVIRAMSRSEGTKPLLARVDAAISAAGSARVDPAPLAAARDRLAATLARLVAATSAAGATSAGGTSPADSSPGGLPADVVAGGRDLSVLAADVLTSALLIEQAAVETARGDAHGAAVAGLWMASRLTRADTGAQAAAVFDLIVDRR